MAALGTTSASILVLSAFCIVKACSVVYLCQNEAAVPIGSDLLAFFGVGGETD